MTTITAVPDPPTRKEPASFADRGDDFLGALPLLATEINLVAGEINDNATTSIEQADIATAQAVIATNEANAAAGSASAAAGSANVTKWAVLTTYTQGVVVWSPINFQTYRRRITGLSVVDPSTDPSNWERITTDRKLLRVKIEGPSVLTGSEYNKLLATSGTFAIVFPAAADLGDGWNCVVSNEGSGAVTLDPAGSGTIDGLTSFVMYPGETRVVQCDGITLTTYILTPFHHTFTTSETFHRPPGYKAFGGLLWSGGGSGRNGSGAVVASGGGGGSCCSFTVLASELLDTESIVIGSGGSSQTTDATNGNAGGNSTFAGITAYGGNGGTTTNTAGGDAFISGGVDSLTYEAPSTSANSTPKSVFAGAPGGSVSAAGLVFSASSVFGGASGAASVAGDGGDGLAPGGGGGATRDGSRSGAGGRGEFRIWGIS